MKTFQVTVRTRYAPTCSFTFPGLSTLTAQTDLQQVLDKWTNITGLQWGKMPNVPMDEYYDRENNRLLNGASVTNPLDNRGDVEFIWFID